MTKMTNVTALEIAIQTLATVEGKAEVVEKLTNIKNSYSKKSTSERKPTATQIANEGLKNEIVALLENEPTRLFTVTEIAKALSNTENEYSNQKISSLCSALYDKGNGIITKTEDKRKSYYSAKA